MLEGAKATVEGRYTQIVDHLVFARRLMVSLVPLMGPGARERLERGLAEVESATLRMVKAELLCGAQRSSARAAIDGLEKALANKDAKMVDFNARMLVHSLKNSPLLVDP